VFSFRNFIPWVFPGSWTISEKSSHGLGGAQSLPEGRSSQRRGNGSRIWPWTKSFWHRQDPLHRYSRLQVYPSQPIPDSSSILLSCTPCKYHHWQNRYDPCRRSSGQSHLYSWPREFFLLTKNVPCRSDFLLQQPVRLVYRKMAKTRSASKYQGHFSKGSAKANIPVNFFKYLILKNNYNKFTP